MTRKTVRLGEVIELKYGKSLVKENRKEAGKFPVYGSSGVVGYHDEYLTDAPCVVVGRKGSIGSVFYSERPCFPIDTAYFVKSKEFHTKYLYYQLSALRLNELNTGAAIPGLNREDVYRKEINLPPIHIQQQIADTLDKADALRRKDKELLQKYDDLAQSIFYDMFGDPMRNEKEWERKKLAECVFGKYGIKAGPFGSSLKKEFYTSNGYKIYGQEQVIADDLNIGDYYISEKKYRELETCKVQAGDVLISMVGTYGKVSVVPDIFEPGIINPRLVKLTFDKTVMLPHFFKFLFQLPEAKHMLSNYSRGGTMDIINAGILKELVLPVPPLHLQEEFVHKLTLNNRAKSLVTTIASSALFQTLLSKHFA